MTELSTPAPTLADAVRGLDLRTEAFIDGAYVDAASGETFDCVSPITGEVIAQVAACDTADVDAPCAARARAFESGVWSRMAPHRRKQILLRLAELIDEHRDELALLETLDMGKPIRDSTSVDIPVAPTASPSSPRRSTRSTTRSRRPRTIERRDDHARAARRRRRGRAVELPAADGVVEARAGARHRQLGRPEAGRAVAADGAAARRAGGRGRPAGGRAPGRARASARPPARRSACTWTSTWSPSPARPRSASCSCATPASRT